MPSLAAEALLVLLLALLLLSLLAERAPSHRDLVASSTVQRGPRPLRPRTPDDCPECRAAAAAPPPPTPARSVTPYPQLKSRRGRKKAIDTAGFACPNSNCRYFNNTDPAIHALVGFGHHGQHDPIRDLFCQACRHKFSARRHTPLYRLKTRPATVAQVLHAVAEGLSPRAAARVFQLPEARVRTWLTRAGQHSQSLHHRLLRALHLAHIQLDELRFKLRGAADAGWLWVACDARTKLIPAFVLGPRTQAMAHQLVHELSQRLGPERLPVFSSDGLALYFYALTAHFGQWTQAVDQRRRHWQVAAGLLYAQLIKRYRRRRLASVGHCVQLGTPDAFRLALRAHGLSGRIQTA